MAQRGKRLSAMQETRVRSLGWEDPLEKEVAAHSSILAGKSHGRSTELDSNLHILDSFIKALRTVTLVMPCLISLIRCAPFYSCANEILKTLHQLLSVRN